MANLNVRIEIDQSAIFNMVRTFETSLYQAELFASKEIERVIRYQVFEEVVFKLGSRAGPGFPFVYKEHLAAFMKTSVPIVAEPIGEGLMVVEFDLDSLGGYSDLELGYHQNALIYEAPGSTFGFTKTGNARMNPHPAQVQLPYQGEPLMNDQERRAEWWEQAIIGRDGTTNFRRGKGFFVVENLPTFEQVAFARVTEAWIPAGVAPEWLLLENGSADVEPSVRPVDFTRTLEIISSCVATRIYAGALVAVKKLADQAGEAISVDAAGGARGRVRSVNTGKFLNYRNEIDESVGSLSGCLGGI